MKVIITTGGSQLLTQIACLNHLNSPLNEYKVYYLGLKVDTLNNILKKICNQFSLDYKGNFPDLPIVYPVNRINIFKLDTWRKIFFKNQIIKSLRQDTPLFKELKSCELVISFRNKVLGDIFLLAGIQPSKVTLTADGVINKIVPRNANNWRWYGVKTPINQIPVSGEIFTPSYLIQDTKKAGKVVEIPNSILFKVFKEAKSISAFKNLEKEFFQLGVPKSIIFSQHLALINACREEIEINLYVDIIKDLLQKKAYPIIFKPHPRESQIKIERLKAEFLEATDKILFLSDKAKVAPIEILASKLSTLSIRLITLSSSAPLCIQKESLEINTYTANYLPKQLKKEIANYTVKYNCKNILIE